jgi:hypothetical protein
MSFSMGLLNMFYVYIEICKSSKCVFPWVFSTCSDKPRPNPTSPKSSQFGESMDLDGGFIPYIHHGFWGVLNIGIPFINCS